MSKKEVREIEVVFREKGAKKLLADIESMTKAELDASNRRIKQMKKESKAQSDLINRHVKWGKEGQKASKYKSKKSLRAPVQLRASDVKPNAPHYAHAKYKAQVNQANQELTQLRRLKISEEKKAKLVNSIGKVASKQATPQQLRGIKKVEKLENKYNIANKKLGKQATSYKGAKLKGVLPFASPESMFTQAQVHPAVAKYTKVAMNKKQIRDIMVRARGEQFLTGINKHTSAFATGKKTPAMIEAEKAHDKRVLDAKKIKPVSSHSEQGVFLDKDARHKSRVKRYEGDMAYANYLKSKEPVAPKVEAGHKYADSAWWEKQELKKEKARANRMSKIFTNKKKIGAQYGVFGADELVAKRIKDKEADEANLIKEWTKAKEEHKAGKMSKIFRKASKKAQEPFGADEFVKSRTVYENWWSDAIGEREKMLDTAYAMNAKYDDNAWNEAHKMNRRYDNKVWDEAHKMNKAYDSKTQGEAWKMNAQYDKKAWDEAHAMNKKIETDKAQYNKDWAEAIKQNAKIDSDRAKQAQKDNDLLLDWNRARQKHEDEKLELSKKEQQESYKAYKQNKRQIARESIKFKNVDRFNQGNQDVVYGDSMAGQYAEGMRSGLEPKFRKRFKEAKAHKAGLGYHLNTPYMRRLAQKFEQEKEIKANERGRVLKLKEKTQKYIDSYVAPKKKSQELSDMASYYKSQEIESARKANEEKASKNKEERKKKSDAITNEKIAKAKEKLEKAKAGFAIKGAGKIGSGLSDIRNNTGSIFQAVSQTVGELTMFAGAIMMVGMMASRVVTTLTAVGDAFGAVEKKFLATAGFRHSLFQKGGTSSLAGFDRETQAVRRYSGYDQFTSGDMLAKAGNEIQQAGGTNVSGMATIAAGIASLTGKTFEESMQEAVKVVTTGKGTDKIGLAELKLTRNIDDNIEALKKGVESNPIAKAMMQRGSIEAAMQRVRSGPTQLMGRVLGSHREQVSGAFNRMGINFEKAFDRPEVVERWSRVLSNLTQMMDRVFTEEKIASVIHGMSTWMVMLIDGSEKLMNVATYFMANGPEIIKHLRTIVDLFISFAKFKIAFAIAGIVGGFGKLVLGLGMLQSAITGTVGILGSLGGMGAVGSTVAGGGIAAGLAAKGGMLGAVGAGLGTIAGSAALPWILGALAVGGLGYGTYKYFQGKKAINGIINPDLSKINNTPAPIGSNSVPEPSSLEAMMSRPYAGKQNQMNGQFNNPFQTTLLVNGNVNLGQEVATTEYLVSTFNAM